MQSSEKQPEIIPHDWSAQDSEACFYEYIRHCREEHRAGVPLPPMFRTRREREIMEIVGGPHFCPEGSCRGARK